MPDKIGGSSTRAKRKPPIPAGGRLPPPEHSPSRPPTPISLTHTPPEAPASAFPCTERRVGTFSRDFTLWRVDPLAIIHANGFPSFLPSPPPKPGPESRPLDPAVDEEDDSLRSPFPRPLKAGRLGWEVRIGERLKRGREGKRSRPGWSRRRRWSGVWTRRAGREP